MRHEAQLFLYRLDTIREESLSRVKEIECCFMVQRYNRFMGLDSVMEELFREGAAAIPGLERDRFFAALRRSLEKSATADSAAAAFLRGLRVRDLALATACAAGSAAAWQTFTTEMRAPLRAAGRAMAGDRGEELADELFGELYTAREKKLATFGGRSSLAGWLRAVLYQTYIDKLRTEKRMTSLDAEREDSASGSPAQDLPAPAAPDPVEQSEYSRIARGALERALAALPPRQKLLLDFYYSQGLTLREAAALVKVHEATASRELDRARATLKKHLTEILSGEYRLGEQEMRQCLYTAAQSGMVWTQEKGT